MNPNSLRKLLQQVRDRKLSPDEAVQRLRHLPFEDLGFAKLDHHRALRQGMPEVIFSQGKTAAQVAKIFAQLAARHPESNILATRATEGQFQAVQSALSLEDKAAVLGGAALQRCDTPAPNKGGFSRRGKAPREFGTHSSSSYLEYHSLARCITLRRDEPARGGNRAEQRDRTRGQKGGKQSNQEQANQGIIAVVSAGTSDIPVAEEAVVTAELMGNKVEPLYDVGVAGIHRLLAHRSVLAKARVIIVCAGMEGALPSVVGGLVGVPVIAVPTSVGYGASFDGLAALLGMLNSCASNVSVVNIDNGFGAAYVASLINRGS